MPQVEGLVEDIVFRNEQNGFTVLSVKAGRERFSAVGALAFIATGERVILEGEWVDHPEYGRQMKIASCETIDPETIGGIERYLGSGLIRGVGPATAKLIVAQFGEQALEILDSRPERIREIPGIGPKRARTIVQSYQQQRAARQALVFLQGYGISPLLSMKIYRAFGDGAQAVVKTNPYLLVEKVEGIGFRTADAIAHSVGIEPESPQRLMCALQYALENASGTSGHMFLPRPALIEATAQLTGAPAALIENQLKALVVQRRLVISTVDGAEAVYLDRLYDAEVEVAHRLCALMRFAPEAADPAGILDYEESSGMTLGEEQRKAVGLAVSGAVCVITGGPGTGKTTGIRCIIELLSKQGEVLLCAPTGRAAKRMSEATGFEAKTIHRLLEYAGEEGVFQRNTDNPIACDALIVDEVSMVDTLLMRSLLRALRPGTRLILVGDSDQLPSVGAGNVLGDLIRSGAVPVARLTEIFRQAQKSMIVVNAHRINTGRMPIVNRRGSDFFWERAGSVEQVGQAVLSLVEARLPDYLGVDALRAIQVMAPMKKGEAGVYRLNRLLQDRLNPRRRGTAQLVRGDFAFRPGDKVMQVKNDYQIEWRRGRETGQGAFNGDIGFVERVDEEERTMSVRFDDERVIEYAEAELESLELSYAISVHKSQGSEFEAIVLPIVSGPPILMTRNLLYTAVTRARRLVVLVGREEHVRHMIECDRINSRFSALSERLRVCGEIGL
jgi:exodeoxyribonuclease V alpha subunit